MDLALSKSDVRVKIGEEDCSVTSISTLQLTCLLPSSIAEKGNEDAFEVTVSRYYNISSPFERY